MSSTAGSRLAGLVVALVLAGCQGRRDTQFQIATATADAEFETVRAHVRDVARELELVERESRLYEPYVAVRRKGDASSWSVVAIEAYPVTGRILVNVEHHYTLWALGRPGEDVYVSVVAAMRSRLAGSYPDAVLEVQRTDPAYEREGPGRKGALQGR